MFSPRRARRRQRFTSSSSVTSPRADAMVFVASSRGPALATSPRLRPRASWRRTRANAPRARASSTPAPGEDASSGKPPDQTPVESSKPSSEKLTPEARGFLAALDTAPLVVAQTAPAVRVALSEGVRPSARGFSLPDSSSPPFERWECTRFWTPTPRLTSACARRAPSSSSVCTTPRRRMMPPEVGETKPTRRFSLPSPPRRLPFRCSRRAALDGSSSWRRPCPTCGPTSPRASPPHDARRPPQARHSRRVGRTRARGRFPRQRHAVRSQRASPFAPNSPRAAFATSTRSSPRAISARFSTPSRDRSRDVRTLGVRSTVRRRKRRGTALRGHRRSHGGGGAHGVRGGDRGRDAIAAWNSRTFAASLGSKSARYRSSPRARARAWIDRFARRGERPGRGQDFDSRHARTRARYDFVEVMACPGGVRRRRAAEKQRPGRGAETRRRSLRTRSMRGGAAEPS